MDILNSAWLLRMLAKAGNTPRERLLALFDILGDWLDAPHTSDKFSGANADSLEFKDEASPLIEYLTTQAKAGGVQEPETLARQLYFMCVSMLQEDMQSPGTACQHARHVAQALIRAQTEKNSLMTKRSAYAMAASVFLVTGILAIFAFNAQGLFESEPIEAIAAVPEAIDKRAVADARAVQARPEQTAALFAMIEQMRKGQCHYPEALQLPDAHKGIYLTNVVNGQISTNAEDQRLVLQLLQKINCNYAPMLMKNSVG